MFRCRSQFNDTNFTLPYGGASRSLDIDFTRLIIGVCNGARIRSLARSLKLLLVIVIMAADNLIHDDLAGMQTTCDLTRKRYTQCRLGISRPVVLRGKGQMPVSPISFHRTTNRNSISRIRVQLPGEQGSASSQIWKLNGAKKKNDGQSESPCLICPLSDCIRLFCMLVPFSTSPVFSYPLIHHHKLCLLVACP